MSLLVEVFVREPDGRRRILDVPDDGYRSGGFESKLTTVWGSEFVRSLGARFLPVPARGASPSRPRTYRSSGAR